MEPKLLRLKNTLHGEVFRRFIRMPAGQFLDYADENGNTVIPTPEECAANQPNILGWWTPIENGAFFGGLYLLVLLRDYDRAPSETLAGEIRLVAGGLKGLQDVARRDGFIARGTATDGVSHFPSSSEDQTAPWIMAMNAYRLSALVDPAEKAELKERLLRTLLAIRGNGWRIPDDFPDRELSSNDWGSGRDWRGMSKLLYCARLIYALTGDEADLCAFEALRDGRPQSSPYTRLEILSHGFSHDMVRNTGLIQFWIDLCAHLALTELSAWDAAHAPFYDAGRRLNGVTALEFVTDIEKYDNLPGKFELDWRPILRFWKPFAGSHAQQTAMALEENAYWMREIVPHRHQEHDLLANALFAAWICLSSGDETVGREAADLLRKLLPGVKWETLHCCYAFAGEGCIAWME